MPKSRKSSPIQWKTILIVASSVIGVVVLAVLLWGGLTKWQFIPSKKNNTQYSWQVGAWTDRSIIPVNNNKTLLGMAGDGPSQCARPVNCNHRYERSVECTDQYGDRDSVGEHCAPVPVPRRSYSCPPCSSRVIISWDSDVYILTKDMTQQRALPNFVPHAPVTVSAMAADFNALLMGSVGSTVKWTYDGSTSYDQFAGSQWIPLSYDVSGYDGAKYQMAAFKKTDKAWISQDFGATFHPVATPDYAHAADHASCVMSFDAKLQLFFFDSYIHYSQDQGKTWVSQNTPLTLAGSMARAQNENPHMVRVSKKGIFVFTLGSPEKAVHAFPTTSPISSAVVDMSSDGRVIAVAPGPSAGPIYISRDFGTTWEQNLSAFISAHDLTVSGAGQMIVAVGMSLGAQAIGVYSRDFGRTFTVFRPGRKISAATVTMSKISGPACGGKTAPCDSHCCAGLTCVNNRCCEGPTACAENTFFVSQNTKLYAYLDSMSDPGLVFTNPGDVSNSITALGVAGNQRNFLSAASNGLRFSTDGLRWGLSGLHGPGLQITSIALSKTGKFQLLGHVEQGIMYSTDGGRSYPTVKGSAGAKVHAVCVSAEGGFAMAFQEDGVWLGSSVTGLTKTPEANVLSGAIAKSAPVQLKVTTIGIFTASTGSDWSLGKSIDFPSSSVMYCDVSSDGLVLAVGGDKGIYTSQDGGKTWQDFKIPLASFDLRGLAVSGTGTTLVAIGIRLVDRQRGYYLSTDGGKTFTYKDFQGGEGGEGELHIVASKV